jgi:hypothetical protein
MADKPLASFTCLSLSCPALYKTNHRHSEESLTSSQGILEHLLEAQELQDTEIDGRVQAKAALVGAESAVELHTVATVDLGLQLVVLPDNAELDDALGNGNDLQGGLVFRVLFEEG